MLRRCHGTRWLSILLALVLLPTTAAVAQEKGQRQKGKKTKRSRQGGSRQGGFRGFGSSRRGGGGASALGLVDREEVRAELKVTDEQRAIIRELAQSARPDFRQFAQLRELPEDQRRKKIEEIQATARKQALEAEEDLYGLVLDDNQAKRLKQIVLQQKGTRALAEPVTAKAVGLSAGQSTKIKGVIAAAEQKRTALVEGLQGSFGGRPGSKSKKGATKKGAAKKKGATKKGAGGERKRPDFSALRERFEKIRTQTEEIRVETDKAVLAVLTADQKVKFAELKGEKFDLPRRSARGRRGGRGGSRSKRPGGGDRPSRPSSKKKKTV